MINIQHTDISLTRNTEFFFWKKSRHFTKIKSETGKFIYKIKKMWVKIILKAYVPERCKII